MTTQPSRPSTGHRLALVRRVRLGARVYAPVNNWNHGAAAIEVDKAGAFHVENFRIIDGAIY